MKILLCIVGVLIGAPALLAPFAALWGLAAHGFTFQKVAGFMFVCAFSFVTMRAAVWLCSARPFWMDAKRLAEVAVVVAAFALLPVAAELEKVSGEQKALVELGAFLSIVALYGLFRFLAPLCMRRTNGG